MSYFQKALAAAQEKATSLAKEKEGVRGFIGGGTSTTSTSNDRLNMIAYCDNKR